jgi:predicted HicB family RNase H-like nuclease
MNQNNLIRAKSGQKRLTKQFLFQCSDELLEAARQTAYANEMSVATFIRQSVKRNLVAYEKLK